MYMLLVYKFSFLNGKTFTESDSTKKKDEEAKKKKKKKMKKLLCKAKGKGVLLFLLFHEMAFVQNRFLLQVVYEDGKR